ncbi:3-oxoacyl-[acyl-carrier-protein] synthase III C-terminal domain-containing protein [Streptomyces sp. NPDC093544]|uniref:3-oxoacyl-[acyl-carrier-protein] synthase III C-terminal domain-containing protein n=1 Tax=Streptomyces sp. NPDC093544 TaxID=3155200 RepID=UPI00344AE433
MAGRTTLERIESYLPERSLRIEELGEHLGLRRAALGVFRKFYGLDTLRFDPDLNLFDLLRPAARRALDALPDGARVAYLVYAHTTQAVAPPEVEVAQVVREELGLDGTEAFALSHQACVSSLGALDVVGELLRAEGDENAYALMVTGERAYSPVVQHIPNTAIMADAAAACLVTLDGEGDEVRSFVTRTLGEYAQWMELTPEQNTVFGEQYGTRIAEVIHRAVAEAGLSFADIELIIPHNVNLLAWRQTIKALDVPVEKVFLDNVPRYSHTFASDVFVNYTTLRDTGLLVDGAHYVMVSVGLGATFGAMVITHRETHRQNLPKTHRETHPKIHRQTHQKGATPV